MVLLHVYVIHRIVIVESFLHRFNYGNFHNTNKKMMLMKACNGEILTCFAKKQLHDKLDKIFEIWRVYIQGSTKIPSLQTDCWKRHLLWYCIKVYMVYYFLYCCDFPCILPPKVLSINSISAWSPVGCWGGNIAQYSF